MPSVKRGNGADFFNIYAYHSSGVREAYVTEYADYCGGTDDKEMLNIIFDTKTYDPGYLCANLEGDLSNMIMNNKNSVAQFAVRKVSAANDWISNFLAGIDDNTDWGNSGEPENPKPEDPKPEDTSSTTTAETTTLPPVFARFDLGTDSKGEALGMTSHQYLVDALTYDANFIQVEYTADSMIVTAVQSHPEIILDGDGREAPDIVTQSLPTPSATKTS